MAVVHEENGGYQGVVRTNSTTNHYTLPPKVPYRWSPYEAPDLISGVYVTQWRDHVDSDWQQGKFRKDVETIKCMDPWTYAYAVRYVPEEKDCKRELLTIFERTKNLAHWSSSGGRGCADIRYLML